MHRGPKKGSISAPCTAPGSFRPSSPGWEEPRNRKRKQAAQASEEPGALMELRTLLWLLWLLCRGGGDAESHAPFTPTWPRSREHEAAAFRVPSARLPGSVPAPPLPVPGLGCGRGPPRGYPASGHPWLCDASGALSCGCKSQLLSPLPLCHGVAPPCLCSPNDLIFQKRFVAMNFWDAPK